MFLAITSLVYINCLFAFFLIVSCLHSLKQEFSHNYVGSESSRCIIKTNLKNITLIFSLLFRIHCQKSTTKYLWPRWQPPVRLFILRSIFWVPKASYCLWQDLRRCMTHDRNGYMHFFHRWLLASLTMTWKCLCRTRILTGSGWGYDHTGRIFGLRLKQSVVENKLLRSGFFCLTRIHKDNY